MEDRIGSQPPADPQLVAEWASSEARDLADATRRRMYEVGRGTSDRAAQAREQLRGALQRTRVYVAGTRERVEGAARRARQRMSHYREGGIEQMTQDVAGYTRTRPMTALLLAAGAGLVLGWLSAACRR